MRSQRNPRRAANTQGIALLIAIFVLLLICVVGIAMMVASGTETALSGNYQSSTTVYYAALAGLEEGRGRLLPINPDYFGKTDPSFLPASGTPLAIGEVRYILSPVSGEVVDPTDPSSKYADLNYNMEFPLNPLSGADVKTTASVSTVAGIPGPPYKWVRINAITEKSINLDVNDDNTLDESTVLYFDGSKLNLNSIGYQALEVTSLAVLPNGSRKILQYVIGPDSQILQYLNTPASPSLNFYSTVTLLGDNTTWDFPVSTNYGADFYVDGNDHANCGTSTPLLAPQYALGVNSSGEPSNPSGMPGSLTPISNYTGKSASPSIGDISAVLPLNLQKPSGIEALIQVLQQNADVVIPGPATASDLPSTMSPTNPLTVFVNGDLTLYGGVNGYGLLVVTNHFTYTATDSWKGLVFVIGRGWAQETNAGGSGGRFDGAVFIARSRDHWGNVLPDSGGIGSSYIDFNNGQGSSFYYSSCWIRAALKPTTYRVLSFHEIPQ